MQNNSQGTGIKGEQIAQNFLLGLGYKIVHCNWRYKRLEVDIIAETENLVVFVEVKTRSSNRFGEPEEFVSARKQAFLIDAAHHYLLENNLDCEARFDVVAITLTNNNVTVKHLPGAFFPGIN